MKKVSLVHVQYEHDSSAQKAKKLDSKIDEKGKKEKPLYIALCIQRIHKHISFSHQEKYDGFEGASPRHPSWKIRDHRWNNVAYVHLEYVVEDRLVAEMILDIRHKSIVSYDVFRYDR